MTEAGWSCHSRVHGHSFRRPIHPHLCPSNLWLPATPLHGWPLELPVGLITGQNLFKKVEQLTSITKNRSEFTLSLITHTEGLFAYITYLRSLPRSPFLFGMAAPISIISRRTQEMPHPVETIAPFSQPPHTLHTKYTNSIRAAIKKFQMIALINNTYVTSIKKLFDGSQIEICSCHLCTTPSCKTSRSPLVYDDDWYRLGKLLENCQFNVAHCRSKLK